MRFTKLRLSGFKSFVDPTELLIEPGMTGVVGPNGCGKSNLVEALRWVMGETSAKQMRGGAMDDVIFNGTQNRPSRNLAEVSLCIDNAERTAPAAFNDGEELIVLRKIERESGSTYRVNGKEVRARDVQLLFADAATGAHSPALVSQGRVGALINSKPTDRRSLLEEAAGITGLHSRRHEAELRLRGAETNLERLQDVMTTLEGQLQQVKRQARQAQRYRKLGEQIRRFEAIALHLRGAQAAAAVEAAELRLRETEAKVAELTALSAQATTAHAEAAEKLPALRQAEAEAGARLHRLALARDALEAEARAAAENARRLEARIAQTEADAAREQALAADAGAAGERLTREAEGLEAARGSEAAAAGETQARVEASAAAVAAEERELEALAEWIASESARRNALGRQIEETNGRIQRLNQRAADAERERGRLEAELAADDRVRAAQEALSASEAQAAAAAEALEKAEAERAEAERRAGEARERFQSAESEAAKLAAEDKALSQLLAAHAGDLFPPLIDALEVKPGFERALGAALGDELERPVDEAAPVHWATLPPFGEPPALPAGAEPLAAHVKAPPALARRLSQIGVVAAADGPRLRGELKQGQRLVTREGALWRWDGYTIGAGAETPAAVRLAQRNRLNDLRQERALADARFAEQRAAFDEARSRREDAQRAANSGREQAREAERRLSGLRQARAEAERQAAARTTRLGALTESLTQLELELTEARAARDEAARNLGERQPLEPARERQAALRQRVSELRGQLAEARAAEAQFRREAQARAARLDAIAAERGAWATRAEGADARLGELAARRAADAAELEQARTLPGELDGKRVALLEQIAGAETGRNQAADALARTESLTGELERALKQAERTQAEAREDRVRAEGGLEQSRERIGEVARRVREALDCRPEEALASGGVAADEALPQLEEAESRFERLRRERDGMGPVNLRAEQEAQELEQQLETMRTEKADLEAAIARLRQGIYSLNREGRERLLAAFKQVDEHFQQLFVRLFGGGKAHLALTEAEDPLEAGLEIMASPPGKRLQIMSLLSGGEQALTAMALIFAVFLTNPAPICVLDEVDAPLDDANVERFCNLVAEIARSTGTRFLCITHHAFTMAKMDRLYGVTMAERGISQLVSVDLARAERLRATA